MPKVTLSQVERRILSNQFKIMSTLDVDKDAAAYKTLATLLEEGYEREYYRVFESFSEPVSSADCDFVADVMEMYTQLQMAWDSAVDKKGVKESDLIFTGFDGNRATGQMSYARFVREDGKWSTLRVKDRDMNSHGMGDSRYSEMLDRFGQLKQRYGLSIEDVIAVLGRS